MNELILIVDDARFARRIAKTTLNNGGYDNLIEAVNAAEAMKMFLEKKPDLTLLDITLPDNSDLTLLQKMLRERPDAKIVMNTAIGQELIIQDAMEAGAKAFITKPFTEKEFLTTVNNVLKAEM